MWQYTRLSGCTVVIMSSLDDLGPNPQHPHLVQASQIHNTSATSLTCAGTPGTPCSPPPRDRQQLLRGNGRPGRPGRLYALYGGSGWYFPLKWGTVGVFHARGGLQGPCPVGRQPAYELFYLGGIDTIRGFKYADISPRDRPSEMTASAATSSSSSTSNIASPAQVKLGLIGDYLF